MNVARSALASGLASGLAPASSEATAGCLTTLSAAVTRSKSVTGQHALADRRTRAAQPDTPMHTIHKALGEAVLDLALARAGFDARLRVNLRL